MRPGVVARALGSTSARRRTESAILHVNVVNALALGAREGRTTRFDELEGSIQLSGGFDAEVEVHDLISVVHSSGDDRERCWRGETGRYGHSEDGSEVSSIDSRHAAVSRTPKGSIHRRIDPYRIERRKLTNAEQEEGLLYRIRVQLDDNTKSYRGAQVQSIARDCTRNVVSSACEILCSGTRASTERAVRRSLDNE